MNLKSNIYKNNNSKFSGETIEESDFKYFVSKEIHCLQILNVLRGNSVGCIFKNVIPERFSSAVLRNAFTNQSNHVHKKPWEEAPPISVGTQHYRKDLETYLDEASDVSDDLKNLFAGLMADENFYEIFMKGFEEYLKAHKIRLRLAHHNERSASPFWIRSFDASEEYVIKPHDDAPQLQCPKQAGFEIQQVKNIVAVNLCLDNQNGGSLIHYNLKPDLAMRKRYDVEFTGYPYPMDALENVQRVEVDTAKGDLYFLNANYIHAVRVPEVSSRQRTTLSWFMGFKDEETVLFWI